MHPGLETRRKIIHILLGPAIIILISSGILDVIGLSAIILLHFIVSVVSIRSSIPAVSWFLRNFDRDEKLPGKGSLTYLGGVLLCLILFRNHADIAFASIMVLALGDSFSFLVGTSLSRAKMLRKTKHPLNGSKLLEGTIAGIVAGTLGAVIFVSLAEAFIASAAAMSAEAMGIRFKKHIIDDNITIPLISGAVMLCLRALI